ncbi:MAG: YggS family pyridoxal phosphate-dependent enzyme [Gemmatimonadetes bacterium]|uniref:Pyridoxal phosphate homeostasis protein n=1 Tax=Candidatus Kutchimonas denitrificans TaxID=3056748 RepID=A0AAE4Z687_9BACT|nr:YggS family pyridoxal phosphate-dependent enzyme [Gemmatimonadota bacterium]NIR74514.1 YggS family pyridoxal phosphate-dependent enzyme [Candidatus Kutchimonas denitrificans]NIS02704.1 YggS family pyridoxal phosphate-dependent enzyme [Gemmatimonadota bacterium]NIT68865.1 YggS family pyridoxal phosphate-dependent enzyme [Gemmatimonadota bacterium]NIU52170.1 YggS family pyridoxal phosphate-dependent enzyme [Gemmatimonadota bacterium]
MYLERLERSLADVRRRISEACERVGRSDPEAVTLVAVTKGHPLPALEAARDAGLEVIGESRVQEAEEKFEMAGDLGLDWHMVGHLQRNKVKTALPMFELIHSVDSRRLAREIEKESGKRGRETSVLVQVNASGEASKYGFAVESASDEVHEICALENVRVLGLMTMAPYTDEEAVLRKTFRRTRELFDRCADGIARFEARHLSMGMTNDFEIAVEEGATMVRLGTALFGER